jgi:hypothetical protein
MPATAAFTSCICWALCGVQLDLFGWVSQVVAAEGKYRNHTAYNLLQLYSAFK